MQSKTSQGNQKKDITRLSMALHYKARQGLALGLVLGLGVGIGKSY
jgi:hypothetical protein